MKRIQATLGIILTFGLVSESWAVGSTGLSTQLAGAKALGQGNAFAGQADDPSALYYNPAGITQLKGSQLMVGGTALLPMVKRTGEGVPDDKIKEELGVVPNFYVTHTAPFGNEKLAIGVGLNSPYGLTTKWDETSSVRYLTTASKFEMINVNPTVAYQVLPQLSLAAGADYVNLFNTVSESQIPQALLNGDNSGDGTANLSGHGSGWGYNVGALYKPADKHSFGLTYRSQVRIPIRGSIELTNLSASTQADYNFASSNYTADATSSIILPASILFGYAFKPTDKWTLLADYEWTQWNSFQNQDVAINETDNSGGLTGSGRLGVLTGNGTNTSRVARNWHNTSAVGLGANFKQNESWQWRGGYAYFQKTVPNDTFLPDVPDAANHLVSVGLSRLWDSFVLDFAINAYIYVDRSVNNSVGNSLGASVNGTYKTFVPALALNLTYKFGK